MTKHCRVEQIHLTDEMRKLLTVSRDVHIGGAHQQPLQSQGREVPTGRDLNSEAAKPLASSGPDARSCTCHPDDCPPVPCPRKFALNECRTSALLQQAAEALEHLFDWVREDAPLDLQQGSLLREEVESALAALRQRMGRE